ncbi:MAG TPA: 5'-nucleotidase C-terminal domain-containing protein [Saprospiraceae bacterium]|nr:5'-nucleotidase C-terminal domain-containing protein [Saprospiraceae bacterium]HMV23475.1 5'-nucleotidase C-terminal domain-containing protein [Saprospiraceae bacterium]HMX83182.1 5'-nucleotidase C-terminal domain-containing protein [Saprospiraceae bacterium]HMX85160.1 5'-nucleotidase C-terminal domain-containing protein [Saprospiraceae bacterium]HMZ73404.1 5'-nucleotidase C-terminal domain-containing protein [Saprospiraceae bacterium]
MKNLIFIGFLLLTACTPKVWHTSGVYHANTRIYNETITDDVAMLMLIQPYKQLEESKMKTIVGMTQTQLIKAKPESPLTNMLADMVQASVMLKTNDKIDATFINYGGVRLGALPEGEISLGKIYELMPFDNMAVILRISGAQLQTFCNHIAKSGGWPVSKSIRFEIKNQQAANITIHGNGLDPDKIYRICVPDYVANGGDDCSFLTAIPQTTYQYLLRDAILDGFKRVSQDGGKVESSNDGRITTSN